MLYKDVPKRSVVNLLVNLKRWFLDERSNEFVFERTRLDVIRIYHPAELNMFTKANLIKITITSPFGKHKWNAYMLEMIVDIAKNFIKRFLKEKEQDVQVAGEKKKRMDDGNGRKKMKKKKKDSRKRAGGRGFILKIDYKS